MDSRKSTLEIACDNPCVVLYGESGAVVSAASYWKVNASLGGTGQALFLLCETEARSEGRVFTDNPTLAHFLIRFNRHFAGFEGVPWFVEEAPAHFEGTWTATSATLACSMAGESIGLEWRDCGDAYLLRSDVLKFGGDEDRSYEVSSVIVPCASGSIRIAGEPQPGRVAAPYGTLPRSSFLAFCETWSRLEGRQP